MFFSIARFGIHTQTQNHIHISHITHIQIHICLYTHTDTNTHLYILFYPFCCPDLSEARSFLSSRVGHRMGMGRIDLHV